MKKLTLLLSSFLFFSTSAQALVSLSINESEVALGNAIQLTIKSDKSINASKITEEISKKAKIRAQSSSTNIQITNNTRTNLYTVTFTIFPFETGKIVFGPFNINQEETNSVSLNVLPAQKMNANTTNQETTKNVSNVVFQAEINPKKIYEGQSIIYKLTLLDPISIYNINIQTPRSNHFSLLKLNQDTVSQEKINETIGRLYQYYYQLTPTNSGKYKIHPSDLSATIPDDTHAQPQIEIPNILNSMFNDRFLISPFQQEKPLYFQSNSIEIEVKPKPVDWQGWWLPSDNVTLQQTFNIPETLHQGEPIERKIILKASSVEPSKLPTLSHPSSANYSFFANPEKRYPTFEQGKLIGNEIQEFLIIPQKEGVLQIPPITLKYFDTNSESEKTITLEGKEITVLPAVNPVTTNEIQETPPPEIKEKETQSISNTQEKTHNYIPYLFVLFGISLLILIKIFLIKLKKKKIFKPIQNINEEKKYKKKKKPLPDLYPF